MKREHSLRDRLHSLRMLGEAIGAMKSLSAHHLRNARSALQAARDYRNAAETALASVAIPPPTPRQQERGAMLVLASDLGLCGAYNSQLANKAIERVERGGIKKVFCVGGRVTAAFRRCKIEIDVQYDAPSSVAGIDSVLIQLAEDLLQGFLNHSYHRLEVVAAQFEGVGQFTPRITRLLPVQSRPVPTMLPPSPYVSLQHLQSVAVREYLFIRLYETVLDALASEHGARLVATESANEWLNEKTAATARQLTAVRREAATQEVLEIAAMCRRPDRAR